MAKRIILVSGEIISLETWLFRNQKNKLAEYFSESEVPFSRENWILHESLFAVIDELRRQMGKPVRINSAYRSETEQARLQRSPEFAAAKNSPHCWGLAVDIDTATDKESDLVADKLAKIAASFGLKYRIGVQEYKKHKQTFVHFDIAPTMFGPGGVWEFMPGVPTAFKNNKLTW